MYSALGLRDRCSYSQLTSALSDSVLLFPQINQSKLFDSCCRTLGLVFQSENFSYNHYANSIMDSWPYLDTPNPDPNHSKLRLNPGETMTAITMLQEQCRVRHLQFMQMFNQLFFIFIYLLNL